MRKGRKKGKRLWRDQKREGLVPLVRVEEGAGASSRGMHEGHKQDEEG